MRFRHIIVDRQTPGAENDVCLIGDVDGNGYNGIMIGGKRDAVAPRMTLRSVTSGVQEEYPSLEGPMIRVSAWTYGSTNYKLYRTL